VRLREWLCPVTWNQASIGEDLLFLRRSLVNLIRRIHAAKRALNLMLPGFSFLAIPPRLYKPTNAQADENYGKKPPGAGEEES
jgi:hypothetical protein